MVCILSLLKKFIIQIEEFYCIVFYVGLLLKKTKRNKNLFLLETF